MRAPVIAMALAVGLVAGPAQAEPGPDAPAPAPAPEVITTAEPTVPDTRSDTDASSSEPPAVAADDAESESSPAQPSSKPDAPTVVDGDGDDEAWDDEDEAWDDEDEAWVDDYDPTRDSPEAIEAKRRVVGGAVLVALGGAVAIGGLAMGLSDPCAPPAGNSCSPNARNRAAVTMGLPGLAVAGAGVALLVIGRRQQAKVRAGAVASRTGGGVWLRARF